MRRIFSIVLLFILLLAGAGRDVYATGVDGQESGQEEDQEEELTE